MNNFDNNQNILGITKLVNNDDENVNLDELEKELIKGTDMLEDESEIDYEGEYAKEMDNLLKKINDKSDNFDNFDDKKDEFNFEKDDKSEKYSDDEEMKTNNIIKRENRYDNIYNNDISKNVVYRSNDKNYIRMTNEEKRQGHIHNVINTMGEDEYGNFNIEKEQEEDDKLILLEQIDMLRQILEDDGINVSRVPEVNIDSNIKDIKNISRILKIKNDRNRLSSLAEEGILLLAAGLEFLFDGEKEYFGFKPDLIGWSETVKIKLRRLKFETSNIVGNVVKNRNMPPGARLVLELVPSMLLYSKSRNTAKKAYKKEIVNDENYKKAISQLNNI